MRRLVCRLVGHRWAWGPMVIGSTLDRMRHVRTSNVYCRRCGAVTWAHGHHPGRRMP